MENKKGFVLYSDQRNLIELLSNEQAGLLFKHIFAYVNDENPVTEDQIINIVFEPIKQQFKRDLKKWEATKESRSKAGLASAESRRINKSQQSSTSVNNVQQEPTKSTVKVNDNVNVKVKVNDNVILLEKETKFKKTLDERKQYFKDRLIEIVKKENIDVIIAKEFYEYWTEPNQTNTKMKFELEKTYDITRRLNTWLQNNIKFNKTNTGNNGKSRTDIQQEGKDRFREKFNQQNFGDGNRD